MATLRAEAPERKYGLTLKERTYEDGRVAVYVDERCEVHDPSSRSDLTDAGFQGLHVGPNAVRIDPEVAAPLPAHRANVDAASCAIGRHPDDDVIDEVEPTASL